MIQRMEMWMSLISSVTCFRSDSTKQMSVFPLRAGKTSQQSELFEIDESYQVMLPERMENHCA